MGIMTVISPDDVDKAIEAFKLAFPAMTNVHQRLLGTGAKAAIESHGKPTKNVIFYTNGKIVANNIPEDVFVSVKVNGEAIEVVKTW